MKRLGFVVALMALGAVPALAQEPARDSAQEEQLRAEVERRFGARVRTELGLNDDQAGKLKATQERYGPRRRQLLRGQLLHRFALQRQMQPGMAANPDSVKFHMDQMQAGRADLLKVEQDEDREMSGYLTPVQRARFQIMRQRFLERVNEMRQDRREMRGQRRQGMQRPPRGRPTRRPR